MREGRSRCADKQLPRERVWSGHKSIWHSFVRILCSGKREITTAFYQSDTAKHLHVYHYAYALNITSQQSSYSESLIHCSYSWHLLTVAFFGSMGGGKGNRSTFVSVTQLLMSMVYCANTLCCLHWLKWGSVWPTLYLKKHSCELDCWWSSLQSQNPAWRDQQTPQGKPAIFLEYPPHWIHGQHCIQLYSGTGISSQCSKWS